MQISQEKLNYIKQLSNSQQNYDDNIACFQAFGHLFNFDVNACLSQTYCMLGKPALNADAMGGIVRKWIDPKTKKRVCAMMKCEFIQTQYDSNNNPLPHTVGVVYKAIRLDELQISKDFGLEVPVHTWSYTMQDAHQRGAHKKRIWQQMPLVMCQKRALTALCRAVFPDVIGTACSPDELAEMMLDGPEADAIMYASTGEQIPYDIQNQLTEQPAKKKTETVENKWQPVATQDIGARNINTIQNVIEALKEENIDVDDAVQALEHYHDKPLDQCNFDDFKRTFYPVAFSPIRTFLKDGRIASLNCEGLKKANVDVNAVAIALDAFYGTSFNQKRDGDLYNYVNWVLNSSHSPIWSEIHRHLQKLLSKDLIDEETQSQYSRIISDHKFMWNWKVYYQMIAELPQL